MNQRYTLEKATKNRSLQLLLLLVQAIGWVWHPSLHPSLHPSNGIYVLTDSPGSHSFVRFRPEAMQVSEAAKQRVTEKQLHQRQPHRQTKQTREWP